MKLNNKLHMLTLCFALALGALTGCSNNNEENSSASTPVASTEAKESQKNDAPKNKVTIEVWNNARHDKDTREALIKKFNETNTDGITIDYKIFSDNYADQLKLAFNSNQLPDLIFDPPQDLYASGTLLNIQDLITGDVKNRFVASAFTKPSYVKDDEFFMIKENVTNYKLVYNKDLFKASGLDPEKPPQTWQEMREYAKIITEKGAGKKYGLGLPIKQAFFWDFYAVVPAARSGELYGRSGWDAKQGKFDFTRYTKYLQWWHDVYQEGSIFPGVGSYDNDMIRAQFSEGNIGMLSGATWDVGVYNDQFPAKIDWGVADFPTWDGTVKGAQAFITSNGVSINKNAKHIEEAKKVWEFFTSDEMYIELTKAGLGSYSNIASTDKALPPSDRKGLAEFTVTGSDKEYIAAPAPDFSIINPPLKVGNTDITVSTARWEIFSQAFLKGGEDIDKLMREISDAYNKLVDESVKAGKLDLKNFVVPDYDPLGK